MEKEKEMEREIEKQLVHTHTYILLITNIIVEMRLGWVERGDEGGAYLGGTYCMSSCWNFSFGSVNTISSYFSLTTGFLLGC